MYIHNQSECVQNIEVVCDIFTQIFYQDDIMTVGLEAVTVQYQCIGLFNTRSNPHIG